MFFSSFDLSHSRSFFYHYKARYFLTVSLQGNTRCLMNALFSDEKCQLAKITPEDTHKPSIFQSYIKEILSYLKLSCFILNLCIAEQLFTRNIPVAYFISSWIRQVITNKTQMVIIALQGKVEQGWLCMAMQGMAGLASASPDLHTLQFHRRGG